MYNDVCVMFCPNELREFRIFKASDKEFLGNDKHFEVMQSSKEQDRDGEFIFEGDILSAGENMSNYVVGFEDGAFKLKDNDCNISEAYKEYRVIGNIYENSELLERTKWDNQCQKL